MKKILIGYLKSKTFWLNVIGGCMLIINASQGYIPDQAAATALAVLNIINRALTNKSLNQK